MTLQNLSTQCFLVCVGPDKENQNICLLTCDKLKTIFSLFQTVLKILVFKRDVYLKAFVLLEKTELNFDILEFFDNQKFDEFGVFKIYHSKNTDIINTGRLLEFKDYTNNWNQEMSIALDKNTSNIKFDDSEKIFTTYSSPKNSPESSPQTDCDEKPKFFNCNTKASKELNTTQINSSQKPKSIKTVSKILLISNVSDFLLVPINLANFLGLYSRITQILAFPEKRNALVECKNEAHSSRLYNIFSNEKNSIRLYVNYSKFNQIRHRKNDNGNIGSNSVYLLVPQHLSSFSLKRQTTLPSRQLLIKSKGVSSMDIYCKIQSKASPLKYRISPSSIQNHFHMEMTFKTCQDCVTAICLLIEEADFTKRFLFEFQLIK